jgi:hypothetical protein
MISPLSPYGGPRNSHLSFKQPLVDNEFYTPGLDQVAKKKEEETALPRIKPIFPARS